MSPEKFAAYLRSPGPDVSFARGLMGEVGSQPAAVALALNKSFHLPGLDLTEDLIRRRLLGLDALGVRPELRGRGIGRALAQMVIDEGRAAGYRLLIADLAADRQDLVHIYTRWGWSVGDRGTGVAVWCAGEPVALNENPDTRAAWLPLHPSVRMLDEALANVFD